MGQKGRNGKIRKTWKRTKFPRTSKAFKKDELPENIGMRAIYGKSQRYICSTGDVLMT